MDAMQVDTDHGAYDALPSRPEDGTPASAVLSVFGEDGALAGYVASIAGGRFAAVVPHLVSGCWQAIGETATAAGAVSAVAAHDKGITAPPA